MVKAILEKIIEGCSEVEKEKDIHKDAKVLAKLVKKDCNDALKKEWVGLTDEEVGKIIYKIRAKTMGVVTTEYVVRAVEAKLKEKNHG